uniref:HMA domain-containing protein n=1 Tax=Oryza brachyantha TaxID=4533 RepID=J3MP72_ORYBR
MADKQPVSLIIKANLECDKCYKKIQKVLLKLKEKEKILRVDYDNKGNKIVICGYFKQEELAQKLRCKLCEAIKDIEIVPVKKLEEKKKVEEKKPDEKKTTEEKKKTDDKKPEEGKKDEKPKPKDKEEAPKAAAVAPSTTLAMKASCHVRMGRDPLKEVTLVGLTMSDMSVTRVLLTLSQRIPFQRIIV